jgi:hypothetical protein
MQLWKPRPDRVSLLDAFPYQGSGKRDLREGRGIAATRANTPP